MTQGLTDLIAELTRANEGSRHLDARIWCLVKGHKFLRYSSNGKYLEFKDKDGETPRRAAIQLFFLFPHYTTSFDAALTLVPEKWWFEGMGQSGDLKTWHVRLLPPTGHAFWGSARDLYAASVIAKTAALALCIAALKARHQPDKENDK